MIINPIYLNSKNSEENDWNPYVMEEDKMLDLTDYSLIEVVDKSNLVYGLYDRQSNSYVKVNSNTTIILGSSYSNGITFKFAGCISNQYQNDGTTLVTPNIFIKASEYFKIKLPSNFTGRYLFVVMQEAGIDIPKVMSCFVHDYDT